MSKLLFTFFIIFTSLFMGYILRNKSQIGNFKFSEEQLNFLRKKLQIIALFFCIPISAMISLWGLPNPDSRLFALPILGLVAFILGGAISIPIAKFIKLNRAQTGSFYCCGTFTNLGAVGTLVCVIFLGESSIAIAALYRLCEEMFYYGISFPIAKWYSQPNTNEKLSFKSFKLDPLLAIVLIALCIGITLNILKIERPHIAGNLASIFMILGTIFLLFSIGLGLKISKIMPFINAGIAVSIIKFIFVPTIVISLAYLLEYNNIDNGLPLKSVAILSCMPVAMNALVPPSLFDLDLDLANACWIFSTLGLIIILPILFALIPYL